MYRAQRVRTGARVGAAVPGLVCGPQVRAELSPVVRGRVGTRAAPLLVPAATRHAALAVRAPVGVATVYCEVKFHRIGERLQQKGGRC